MAFRTHPLPSTLASGGAGREGRDAGASTSAGGRLVAESEREWSVTQPADHALSASVPVRRWEPTTWILRNVP